MYDALLIAAAMFAIGLFAGGTALMKSTKIDDSTKGVALMLSIMAWHGFIIAMTVYVTLNAVLP